MNIYNLFTVTLPKKMSNLKKSKRKIYLHILLNNFAKETREGKSASAQHSAQQYAFNYIKMQNELMKATECISTDEHIDRYSIENFPHMCPES